MELTCGWRFAVLAFMVVGIGPMCVWRPCDAAATLNSRPVIGILAQSAKGSLKNHGDTFFAGSYVTYLEESGSLVVPVRVNQSESYYIDLMSKINGVLFPGGGVDILNSGYAKAAQIIYKLAIQYNEAGSYFPLWGTCLGFELLSGLTSGENLLASCDAEDLILPLQLVPGFEMSRVFREVRPDVLQYLQALSVTANYHQFCLTPQNYSASTSLKSFYRVLSTNKDRKGKEFISMMEAYDYPFFGSQWHPEKNAFDWNLNDHVTHTWESARVGQYFSNFFVNEARKSDHRFPSIKEQAAALIQNYNSVFLGPPSFHHYYFFNYTEKFEDSRLLFEPSLSKM